MHKKKNICFIDFDMSVIGGVEQVTSSLVNELSKYYGVHVISIVQKGKEPVYTWKTNVQYTVFFREEARLREYIAGVFPKLRKYLKANKIDIAFLMGNYPGIVSIFVKAFVKTKFVFCDHGALMNQWKRKDIRYIRFIVSKLADKTITLTEKSRNDYIERFKLKKSKVDYIYNWVEMPEEGIIYQTASRSILSVGRFGKEKGYDMLLKAAGKVLPACPEWEWHIFGDGETFEDIVEQSRRLGLEGRLIFHGNQPDIYKKYRNYAMLVLTSYREGLPLVLLEGKANKLPLVSFDVETGPAEIIKTGVNGYLIEPYDVEDMAEKIIQLIKDEKRRKDFSDMAYCDIEKFEKKSILCKWINLIENI